MKNNYLKTIYTIAFLLFSTFILNAQIFTEQTGIPLIGGYNGDVSWVDYDNDSDLDLFVTGIANDSSKIYRNNGNNTFTEETGFYIPSYCKAHLK